MAGPTDYTAATEYLFGQKARGVKFGIDRMTALAAALGNPERALPVIHVAGTNGKGSTAAMIEAILRAAGWRTGLYTSPHLLEPGERVQVDRQPLTQAELVAYVRELRPLADRIGAANPDDHPSFFEFMTAMAFLQFTRQRCDIAVIEVGLGGRLDATNLVAPEVSVITSIALDHCEILGDRLEQIAAEKAGIIKPGRPAVIGRMPRVAEDVIRKIAAERRAPLVSVRERYGESPAGYPVTSLDGEYQRWNAATATETVRILAPRWRITPEAIVSGLTTVDWPGRWQRVDLPQRRLILDASHNPEGAEVLERNLARLQAETARPPVVIVGVLGTARAAPLLGVICRFARTIHLVAPHQPRATSLEELRTLIPPDFSGQVVLSEVEELFPGGAVCRAGEPGDTVIVTGSIYLLGEVIAKLGRGASGDATLAGIFKPSR